MATFNTLKTKIQGLINQSNATTGITHTDLTNAVGTLIKGYGVGSDSVIGTWRFNDIVDTSEAYADGYHIQFTFGQTKCNYLEVNSDEQRLYYGIDDWIINPYGEDEWVNVSYQTITITGYDDPNIDVFKTWLKANATREFIEIVPEYDGTVIIEKAKLLRKLKANFTPINVVDEEYDDDSELFERYGFEIEPITFYEDTLLGISCMLTDDPSDTDYYFYVFKVKGSADSEITYPVGNPDTAPFLEQTGIFESGFEIISTANATVDEWLLANTEGVSLPYENGVIKAGTYRFNNVLTPIAEDNPCNDENILFSFRIGTDNGTMMRIYNDGDFQLFYEGNLNVYHSAFDYTTGTHWSLIDAQTITIDTNQTLMTEGWEEDDPEEASVIKEAFGTWFNSNVKAVSV